MIVQLQHTILKRVNKFDRVLDPDYQLQFKTRTIYLSGNLVLKVEQLFVPNYGHFEQVV